MAVGMGGALLAALFDQGRVAGVLGKRDGAVGQNTEGEGRDRGECQAHSCRYADGAELTKACALSAGFCVDRGKQAQIVKTGDAAVEQADDRQPDVAVVDGS